MYSSRSLCIVASQLPITGANTPLDLRTVAVPAGITHWFPTRVSLYCEGTGNSLAAATLGIWTSTGGLGTSLLSAASGTLTNLTTIGAVQTLAVSTATMCFGTTGITFRQDLPAAASATGLITALVYLDAFG